MVDPLVQAMETFTLIGVLFSALVFARLALKARSLGSFRFQLSVFMLVWVAAEVPHIAETLGLIVAGSLDELGLEVHMISMTVFAVFVGLKSYRFLRIKPLPPFPSQVRPVLPTGALEK